MKHFKTKLLIAIGSLILIQALHAATPASTLQLQSQVRTLENKIRLLEAQFRSSKTRSTLSAVAPAGATSSTQLNEINRKLNRIMQVLQITSSGVTLKSAGTLNLQAGTSMNLEAKTSARLKGGSQATLESAGITHVKGATVKLNNGSRPVARVGSKTAGGPSTQSVLDGSNQILVP